MSHFYFFRMEKTVEARCRAEISFAGMNRSDSRKGLVRNADLMRVPSFFYPNLKSQCGGS